MVKDFGNILLVDDDLLALQIFADSLKKNGLTFDTASTGADAIEKINEKQYELIICDVLLGDLTGIDVLKHAKKHSPSTEIVLITAHSHIDTVLDAFKYGATDYLKKPISGIELLFTIERIIERKKIINGYSAYQRYNELLQLSHQIALTTDLNSLIHTSMQAISHYFKAESSVFIKYKRNIKKKYSVLGKINISENLINEVVSSFFKKNTIDEHSCTLTIEKNLVCIPITQTGFSYFLFLINPIVIEDYSHSQVGQNGHFYTEIEFLQKQTSLALKNILKINDAKTLALTDDLTGLRNQRYLESHLEYELKLAKKHKKPLSLLFIDIDKFKCVNDQHGHLIGSKILRELAEVMKRSVRDPEKDKIIRYGGDEYVIILSNLDSEGAYKVAERLRKKVEGYIFLKADKKISVTISIGISNYPETSFTKEEILNLADKALYAAKKLSRNAVYSASKMNL